MGFTVVGEELQEAWLVRIYRIKADCDGASVR